MEALLGQAKRLDLSSLLEGSWWRFGQGCMIRLALNMVILQRGGETRGMEARQGERGSYSRQ